MEWLNKLRKATNCGTKSLEVSYNYADSLPINTFSWVYELSLRFRWEATELRRDKLGERCSTHSEIFGRVHMSESPKLYTILYANLIGA